MPLTDQRRLAAEAARPRILRLWEALQATRSPVRFMNSGAHPDDETSAMLAALAFRDGLQLSYVCATRGEGGQNDIGTEAGAELGALRTAEMERAAARLRLRLYWLGRGPDDPIRDFGFSKSGEETLARWGRAATLARFVAVVRAERPDILCPTFLDVPGQHGHHRAMTELAHAVVEAAADPGFDDPLPPWRIAKLCLPAWSGAGQSYDDDLPPPEASFAVEARGTDPVSGWTWERIGQQSRACHRTQGMGRWVPAGAERDWPLHLAHADPTLAGAGESLTAGLPTCLADLADAAPALREPLAEADARLAAARAAFSDGAAIVPEAAAAIRALRRARDLCPAPAEARIGHRLRTALATAEEALLLAAGVEARGVVAADWLHPGDRAAVALEHRAGAADRVEVALALPDGWVREGDALRVTPEARPSDPFRDRFDPAAPPAPALAVTADVAGLTVSALWPLDHAPAALPAVCAALDPDALLLNTAAPRPLVTAVLDRRATGDGHPALAVPEGWRAFQNGDTLSLRPAEDPSPALHRIPLLLDGVRAAAVRRMAHDHVPPVASHAPAVLRLRVLEAILPEVRVGYAGAGRDRVGHWLRALGADVTDLADADLAREAALERIDTLVVGLFALRFRPALAAAMPRLHRWVEAGGTLLTLYHRPWDNWDPDVTPPRRLEIGQPSLRWRVTDETAEVRPLVPDHPLLTVPNRIGPVDWEGWVKERGLYFAKAWDPAYVPLLEMADPGEAPHRGALLAADIGAGRHVHCALILHHQMENLVPGAFRLMANLIARR